MRQLEASNYAALPISLVTGEGGGGGDVTSPSLKGARVDWNHLSYVSMRRNRRAAVLLRGRFQTGRPTGKGGGAGEAAEEPSWFKCVWRWGGGGGGVEVS